ncbi:MAG: hypothetical protein MI810_01900, partial [Flavobacteriales bacterium]|nr:hypothetical protein [Flavobacteriales bacterium]
MAFIFMMSTNALATKETYTNRKQADAFSSDFSFEVIDKRFDELGTDAFYDRSTQLLVRFGVDEDISYGYIPEFDGTTVDVTIDLTVEALNGGGTVLSTETTQMTITYSPSQGGFYVDQAIFKTGGYNRYRIEVALPTGFPTTVPENIYIEGELSIDRYYEISTTTPVVGASYLDYSASSDPTIITGTAIPTNANELEIWWDYIEGAEEYELQWTWVDNYSDSYGSGGLSSPLTASEIDFNELDFARNNSRIIT